ncbi:MAG: PilZ domain-containing protein [Oscillospiraceae bacterium]
MEKLGIKTSTKLVLQIVTAMGDGTEFKSSFVQENGKGECLVAMPMKDGKSCVLESDTRINVTYEVGENTYTFSGTISGTLQKGPRTYLVVRVTAPPQKHERRTYVRIAAALPAEITSYRASTGELLPSQVFPASTSDVSQGGLSLHTDAPVIVGEIVGVNIFQPVKKGTQIKPNLELQAKVCWVRSAAKGTGFSATIGVQFLFRDSGEIEEVKRLFFSLSAPR